MSKECNGTKFWKTKMKAILAMANLTPALPPSKQEAKFGYLNFGWLLAFDSLTLTNLPSFPFC